MNLNIIFFLGVVEQFCYSMMIISTLIAYHYGNKTFATLAQVLCWIVGIMSVPAIVGIFGIVNIAVAISCYRISRRTRPSLRREERKREGPDDILDAGL